MKKKILILILLVSTIFLCSCKSNVGYWEVQEISAGDVVMTSKDGQSLGLNLGSFKLCKSGKAEVCLLEDKLEGKWEEKDGKIVVTYGEHTATGERNGKNITFEDDQTVIYKCHNIFG